MSELGTNLAHALRYAAKGWPVFPLHSVNDAGDCSCHKPDCDRRGKHPRFASDLTNGLHSATTDPEQIKTWFTRWPDANIGGRTGVAFDVIDLDGPEGIEGFRSFCAEHNVDPMEFPRSATGRMDGGRHLFLSVTGRGCEPVAPHIDYRGDGGYIVLPPSRHVSGNVYAWKAQPNGTIPEAPEPVLAWLAATATYRSMAASTAAEPVDLPTASGTTPWGRARLERCVRTVEAATEGERNNTLNRMAYKVWQAIGSGQIEESVAVDVLISAAVGVGLGPSEARRTVQSARKGLEQPKGPAAARPTPQTATEAAPAPVTEGDEPAATSAPLGVSLALVEEERIEWLWQSRIPLGKVTIIDGHPGLGKSALHIDIASRVTTGRPMPDDTPGITGNVVLFCAEDGAGDTIKPRCVAAGADCRRITVVSDAQVPMIPDDLGKIEELIVRTAARMVVFDPLFAYVNASAAKSISDQEMRQKAMTPLTQLAGRTGTAIVLIRHLSKTQGMGAVAAGAGSMGIIGAARMAMMVGADPEDDERRVLAVTKTNIAIKAPSLAWRLRSHEDVDAPVVEWLGESTANAETLLERPASDEDRTAHQEACEYLREVLGDHVPHPAGEVQKEAAKHGISVRTLRRARVAIKATNQKLGGGPWVWQLPWTGQGVTPLSVVGGSREGADHRGAGF